MALFWRQNLGFRVQISSADSKTEVGRWGRGEIGERSRLEGQKPGKNQDGNGKHGGLDCRGPVAQIHIATLSSCGVGNAEIAFGGHLPTVFILGAAGGEYVYKTCSEVPGETRLISSTGSLGDT